MYQRLGNLLSGFLATSPFEAKTLTILTRSNRPFDWDKKPYITLELVEEELQSDPASHPNARERKIYQYRNALDVAFFVRISQSDKYRQDVPFWSLSSRALRFLLLHSRIMAELALPCLNFHFFSYSQLHSCVKAKAFHTSVRDCFLKEKCHFHILRTNIELGKKKRKLMDLVEKRNYRIRRTKLLENIITRKGLLFFSE